MSKNANRFFRFWDYITPSAAFKETDVNGRFYSTVIMLFIKLQLSVSFLMSLELRVISQHSKLLKSV